MPQAAVAVALCPSAQLAVGQRLPGHSWHGIMPRDGESRLCKKSLWVGTPLSCLETMSQGCCCQHKEARGSRNLWPEGACGVFLWLWGGGWLVPVPSRSAAWMFCGWRVDVCIGQLWGCQRVLPDHAIPELVLPPSSVRTVPFGAARALWEVLGTGGASRAGPCGAGAFCCSGPVESCCAEV